MEAAGKRFCLASNRMLIWTSQRMLINSNPQAATNPQVLTNPQVSLRDQVSTTHQEKLPTWFVIPIVLKPPLLIPLARSPYDLANVQTQTLGRRLIQLITALMAFVLTNRRRGCFDPVRIDPVPLTPASE